MLQVRGNRCGLDGFVGKLTSQQFLEAFAKLFTRQLTCGTLEIGTHKLETIRARTPKALYGQNQRRI
jgi:hypothetical protein